MAQATTAFPVAARLTSAIISVDWAGAYFETDHPEICGHATVAFCNEGKPIH